MTPEQITERLVEYKTTQNKPEEIENALEFLEGLFDQEEFSIQRFESQKTSSLLISFNQDLSPVILLHGHLDVVGAEEKLFRPRKKNSRIYGRGTADMKAGVACCIKVMHELEAREDRPDVALLLTTDEELGGFNGTGHVVEQGLAPDFVVSAEPDDSGSFPSIVVEQKGVLQLKILASGRSAHGSKPGKGENAAEKLMQKYFRIKELFSEGEFATTVNLGKFRSGQEVNKVPEEAEMHLDIRYTDEYSKEEVLEDIQRIEDLEVEVTAEAPMMQVDEENSYVRKLSESIDQIGEVPELRRENFASDMRFFTSKGIPAVCFGPEGYNLHGEDEYVEVEGLSVYCEILKNFLESINN